MRTKSFLLALSFILGGAAAMAEERKEKLVIAHRGASGYLPEHTLAAKALAYGMGADFLEQDVVLTKDERPIVLHDIHLDTVTDVAEVYPERARDDGRYYAIDFTLDEIRRLRVHERIDHKSKKAVFPRRFPPGKSSFRIPTLAEEIELVQGLNKSTGRNVGVYPEIKAPAWHRKQGHDISRVMLDTLTRYGYRSKSDRVFLQCFDPLELRRIRGELGCKLRLVQLIGENDWKESAADYEAMRTPVGLREIAGYADGVGPRIEHIVLARDGKSRPVFSDLVDAARRNGLVVHPYTFRADSLPKFAETPEQLMQLLFDQADVDGLFADFPDRAARFLNRKP